MADEQPVPNVPLDDERRDTVRINLPQGNVSKPPAMPTPTVRLRPSGAPPVAATAVDNKKATAAITQPVATVKAKSDTSAVAAVVADSPTANPKKDTARVQMPVPAAKPSVPEMPRPTVKLKREEPAAPAPAPAAPQAPPAAAVAAVPVTASWIDTGLSIAAMAMALVVAIRLFVLNGN